MADHEHIELGDIGSLSAAEIHEVLLDLKAERELAVGTPLGAVRSYMDDLERELEAVDYLYVLTAVTEVAAERARHEGALVG